MNKVIVIIDDDWEDLYLLKDIALEMGLANEVITFDDPEKAIQFLRDLQDPIPILFIISDINMPKINGFELRRSMLEMGRELNNTPFFFLSTSKMLPNADKAIELKITAFYEKPDSVTGIQNTFICIASFLDKSIGDKL